MRMTGLCSCSTRFRAAIGTGRELKKRNQSFPTSVPRSPCPPSPSPLPREKESGWEPLVLERPNRHALSCSFVANNLLSICSDCDYSRTRISGSTLEPGGLIHDKDIPTRPILVPLGAHPPSATRNKWQLVMAGGGGCSKVLTSHFIALGKPGQVFD